VAHASNENRAGRGKAPLPLSQSVPAIGFGAFTPGTALHAVKGTERRTELAQVNDNEAASTQPAAASTPSSIR